MARFAGQMGCPRHRSKTSEVWFHSKIMTEPKIILVVCTGNICRSPMAAGLLRDRLESAALAGDYKVRSAGTWAAAGSPPTEYACQVMARRGIDITHHRSRDIGPRDIAEADLILVMTAAHREAILAEFPDARSKTYLLSQMIGKSFDIADPVGSSLAHYEYCAEDLSAIIDAGFEQIVRLAQENWHEAGGRA